MPSSELEIPANYAALLASLQERIRGAQVRAALSVNRELVLLYWQIGREILIQQGAQGWGARVIDRLSQDLRQAFPEMKGFSARNLKYMRAFAEAWPDEQFVQEVACTNHLVSQHARCWKNSICHQNRVVRPQSHRERLEPRHSGASDRHEAAHAAGQLPRATSRPRCLPHSRNWPSNC